ncbi:MAG: hypothetical protein F6K39_48575 [Okeania sp. SIO3B3]|nr:hypothetical protein [Okeania sp. SIO3B3]
MHVYRKPLLCLISLILPIGALIVLNVGLIGAAGENENLTRLTTSIFPKTNSLPAINSDGTKLVFASGISPMYSRGIPGEEFDIWLYDTATMTATRLTTSTGLYRDSLNPDISGDGTKIVFESNADFLGQGIPVNQREIWLYDTKTMTLTRITTASLDGRSSFAPAISSDGTVIAFTSSGDFLNENLSELQSNGWLYDTKAMTLTRIPDAAISNSRLAINGDGTQVVFNRRNRIFDHETNQLQWQTEVWFYDTPTMTITQVTTSVGSGVRQSAGESISDDGTKIVFRSDADFLGQGIPEGQDEIWLYDTTTMTVTRITTAPNLKS